MQAQDLSSSVNNLYKSDNFFGLNNTFSKFSQQIEKRQKIAIRLFFAVVS
jgi:hypothetical protein